jgi:hypothetical protein
MLYLCVLSEQVKLRGHYPSEPFEKSDPARTGRVTRLQFKSALRDIGFVLVDEPLPDSSSHTGTNKQGKYFTNIDVYCAIVSCMC